MAAQLSHLQEALRIQAHRERELFNEWDADVDGLVSKVEFRRALKKLGLTSDSGPAAEPAGAAE